MKKFVLFCMIFFVGIITIYNIKIVRYNLPEGELKWSYTKPINAKVCLPAAFTDQNGNIEGSYKINNKSYQNNSKRKVSLENNTFHIGRNWKTDNGFQQIVLVYNNKCNKFKDTRIAVRRALCKIEGKAFILESLYPMTLTDFAIECNKKCKDAIYLDMGEYGYGYIKYFNIKIPLFICGYFSKDKQTNWLYIQ